MKNKKSIAIAMSAMTVAGAVVPAFATGEVHTVTPQNTTVDVTQANGRILKKVAKNDLTVFLKANKDAKIVGEAFLDSANRPTYYVVEINNPASNDAIQAGFKAQVKKAEEDLDALSKETYYNGTKNVPRYTIGINKTHATIDGNTGNIMPGTVVYTVKDNLKPNQAYIYQFLGMDTEYVYNPSAEYVIKNINGIDKVELNIFIYKMQQAKKKYGDDIVIVPMETGNDQQGYRVEVWSGDKKVKLAEINLKGSKAGIDYVKTVHGVNIPLDNDFAGHWAEDEILEQMILEKIAIDKKYRPKENITRAEFAVMVYRNNQAVVDTHASRGHEHKFKDVAQKAWYSTAIEQLAKAGYVSGYTDGTFKPQATITRQEAAAILAGVKQMGETKHKDITGKYVHTDIQTNFKDDKDIAIWADESVENLAGAGIIKGYSDNTFKPKNNISRAEAACIVNR